MSTTNEEVIVLNEEDMLDVPTPEGEEGMDSNLNEQYIDNSDVVINEEPLSEPTTEEQIEEQIKEKLNSTGMAYVYDGKILDESKLNIQSKNYVIYNPKTGLPFIYNGDVVHYGNKTEATASLITLRMFTSNEELVLLDLDEFKGKSLL